MNTNERTRHSGTVAPRKLNTPVASTGTCGLCGKRVFASRKEAKQFAKKNMPSDPPRPYRCDGRHEYWHLGHLPDAVLAGDRSRDSIGTYAAPRRLSRDDIEIPEREPIEFNHNPSTPPSIPTPSELATRLAKVSRSRVA